jgi:hypothetical protein
MQMVPGAGPFLFAIRPCKKVNPRWKSGAPNQKPLTIKPYPMKIRR